MEIVIAKKRRDNTQQFDSMNIQVSNMKLGLVVLLMFKCLVCCSPGKTPKKADAKIITSYGVSLSEVNCGVQTM